MQHHKNHLKEFLILLLIVAVLVFSTQFNNFFKLEDVVSLLKTHPIEGGLFYIIYATISVMVITLPVVPLWPVVLLIYPFWVAFLLSLTGQILGATFAFWLARKFGKSFVQGVMGNKLFDEIEHFVKIDKPTTFILIRIFGNNYFDPISYIAGLSKMSFKAFFIITVLTSSLWLTIMLYLINRLGGLENMKGLLSIMGIYGGFILVGTIIWEIFHRQHKKHHKIK